jgi:hypothetical protein
MAIKTDVIDKANKAIESLQASKFEVVGARVVFNGSKIDDCGHGSFNVGSKENKVLCKELNSAMSTVVNDWINYLKAEIDNQLNPERAESALEEKEMT